MYSIFDYNSYELTSSEKYLVEQINRNPKQFISLSISQIAKLFSISESTISRLCQKLNCPNFKTLRSVIKNRYNLQEKSDLKNKVSEDLPEYLIKIRNYSINSIFDIFNKVEMQIYEQIIQHIIHTNKIFVYGMGSSGLAAHELSNNLNQLGFNSHTSWDLHRQLMFLSTFKETDLFILFSITGKTKEIINLISFAKKHKIKILLITTRDDNDPEVDVDFKIKYLIPIVESTAFPIISSKTSQHIIADIITNVLMSHLPEETKNRVYGGQKIVNFWQNKGKIDL